MKSIKRFIELVSYALIMIFVFIILMSSLFIWFGYIGLGMGFVGSVIIGYLISKLSNNFGVFNVLDLLIKFLVKKFNYAIKVSKKNPQTILLVIILLIISTPYITQAYKGFVSFREEQKARQLQESIEAERKKISEENQRRELILSKYKITKLKLEKNPFGDGSFFDGTESEKGGVSQTGT